MKTAREEREQSMNIFKPTEFCLTNEQVRELYFNKLLPKKIKGKVEGRVRKRKKVEETG